MFKVYAGKMLNSPRVARTIVIAGQIRAATIILFGRASLTSLSAQAAMVSAPPVENGEQAVESPPKKMQV